MINFSLRVLQQNRRASSSTIRPFRRTSTACVPLSSKQPRAIERTTRACPRAPPSSNQPRAIERITPRPPSALRFPTSNPTQSNALRRAYLRHSTFQQATSHNRTRYAAPTLGVPPSSKHALSIEPLTPRRHSGIIGDLTGSNLWPVKSCCMNTAPARTNVQIRSAPKR